MLKNGRQNSQDRPNIEIWYVKIHMGLETDYLNQESWPLLETEAKVDLIIWQAEKVKLAALPCPESDLKAKQWETTLRAKTNITH